MFINSINWLKSFIDSKFFRKQYKKRLFRVLAHFQLQQVKLKRTMAALIKQCTNQ